MGRKRPSISFEKHKPVARHGDLEQMFTESTERLRLLHLPVDQIVPDPNQPRRTIDNESIDLLADSIKESGVIQPIEVVQTGRNSYRIIHGERRWRASRMAKQETIPALVKRTEYDDTTRYVRQLVENMQREDLNDVDRAAGLIHLRELMQEEAKAVGQKRRVSFSKVAEKVGYSRQRVSQLVSLLNLPEEMRQAIQEGWLSERETRLFQRLSPTQQKQLFKVWAIDKRVSQAEMKQITDLIKDNSSLSVERAIALVKTGERKEPVTPTQLERNRRGAGQVLKGLRQINVEGLDPAESNSLLKTLSEATQILDALTEQLHQQI